MTMHKGFSLIEVMVVVAILAILTTIALPSYRDYVLRGKIQEATSALSDGVTKMEQFFQDNRTYLTPTFCGAPYALDTKAFEVRCIPAASLTATTFTLTATGKASEGMGNFAYTINQNRARSSTITEPGWSSGATCWITKKGETC